MNTDSLSILYIEDNLDDKIILEEYISDIFNVKLFISCDKLNEAQSLLVQCKVDLIFLDLSLPDVNGIDAVSELIKITQSAIPIVVLTGNDDQTIALESLKIGAQDFLIKGEFTKSLLFKTIQYSIERHKVQLELILKNEEILIARNRLLKAEEMAELGSWEINLDSRKVNLSNGMKQLLNLSQSTQLMDLSQFTTYISYDNKHTYIDSLLDSIDGTIATEIEADFVKESGEILRALCKAEVRFDENNIPIEIYGITLDISKIKEAERVKEKFTKELASKVKERTAELEETRIKLEESLSKEKELGDLKSRFVSTASHQFRTPLTVIQSNIGLLEMQTIKMNPEYVGKVEKITSRVKKEVQRMTNIMNEVLVLGKISSGVLTPFMEKISVVKVCKHVLAQYNHIQEDGRKAVLQINEHERSVHLDKNLFEQAMSNIVSNAFKYSKGSEPPVLNILFEGEVVNIQVIDKGMGIPNKDLKNLFTPFFRASNVLDIPGNGLGTAIIKEYIELNNGTVNVESALGEGTTFSIHFKVN